MNESGKYGGKGGGGKVRTPLFGLLPWATLVLFLGCAHNPGHPEDLPSQLKADRSRNRKIEALSRENSVLAEEKRLLEKDVARLREELERTHRARERERSQSDSTLRAVEEKAERLDDSLDQVSGSYRDSLDGERERTQAETDSLKRGCVAMEDSLRRGLGEAERESERRGRELQRLGLQYEKDRYAWERMKEELFRRLEAQTARPPAPGPSRATGNVADTLPRP